MTCQHTIDESWWASDGQGIPVARVCGRCCDYVMQKYRPEILQSYTQADVDEQIEED